MKSLLVIFAIAVTAAVAFPEPELRERRGILSPAVAIAPAPLAVAVAPKIVAPVVAAQPWVARAPVITKTVLPGAGWALGK